ncbi:hypothetical protein ACTFJW_15630 [Clostridium cagae]|uniref:hypothetical protein n=1 Tax=Clostridium cagae TaxID=2080751 RepID=UPI003F77751E
MGKKKKLTGMLIVSLLMISGLSTVASAEELYIPTFRNVVTGVTDTTNEILTTTSWKYIDGYWYYLKPSGEKVTGWINDNGNWYFCDSLGRMLHDTVINNFKLGNNGAWIY